VFVGGQSLAVSRGRRHVREKAEVLGASNCRFAHEPERLSRVVTFDQCYVARALDDRICNLVQQLLALLTRHLTPFLERGFRRFAGSIDIIGIARRNLADDTVVDRCQALERLPGAAVIVLPLIKCGNVL
jgi:hypothetical protein